VLVTDYSSLVIWRHVFTGERRWRVGGIVWWETVSCV